MEKDGLINVIVKNTMGSMKDLTFPSLEPSLTILELKMSIQNAHPKNPAPSEQRLVCGGKLVLDNDRLEQLLVDRERSTIVLHLALRLDTASAIRSDPSKGERGDKSNIQPSTNYQADGSSVQSLQTSHEHSSGVRPGIPDSQPPLSMFSDSTGPSDNARPYYDQFAAQQNNYAQMQQRWRQSIQQPQPTPPRQGVTIRVVFVLPFILLLLREIGSSWNWILCLSSILLMSYWSRVRFNINLGPNSTQTWTRYIDWRNYSGWQGEVLGFVVPFFLSMLPFWHPEEYAYHTRRQFASSQQQPTNAFQPNPSQLSFLPLNSLLTSSNPSSPSQPSAASPSQPSAASPSQPSAASPSQPSAASPSQPSTASPSQPPTASPSQPRAASSPQPSTASPSQPRAASPSQSLTESSPQLSNVQSPQPSNVQSSQPLNASLSTSESVSLNSSLSSSGISSESSPTSQIMPS
ncbi:uncharacterized protein LOC126315252 [Schistocerca gregaria]|uniref:uncharacterized protein LOC126315252 n=1 Tax=Schistocerca gregaria TaxID=7010 RepID=UPI00211E75A9|nr:uncharacterized protein LOC126315252 [Schistocerca gregaria]